MFVPPFSRRGVSGARPRPRALGKPQFGDVKILMMDREGRRRWRQDQLFKLRAKPLDFEKRKFYK
jgi:hypothetical protein